MKAMTLALIAVAAGLGVAPTANAQRSASSGFEQPAFRPRPHFTLRCRKVRDRAEIVNVGQQAVLLGSRIDVSMWEPDGSGPAVATGLTTKDIVQGDTWIHPIRFSETSNHCDATVTKLPGDIPF